MSIAEQISKLNDFKPQVFAVDVPEVVKPHKLKWEDIRHLDKAFWDNITDQLQEGEKVCRANRTHNEIQLAKVKEQLVEFATALGLQPYNNSKTLYAQYKNIIKDVESVNGLGSYSCFSFRRSVEYKGHMFYEDSYDAYSWFLKVKAQTDSIDRRQAEQRRVLIDNIKYAVENGIEVGNYQTDEDLNECVDKLRSDAAILTEYPVGKVSMIRHQPGIACSVTHGERFCDCNKVRVGYNTRGHRECLEASFYWQQSSDLVDAQTWPVHPSLKQSEVIPF